MAKAKEVPALPSKKSASSAKEAQKKLAAKVKPEAEETKYKFPDKWKNPKKLPDAADAYAAARIARLEAEKNALLLKVEEEALRQWLLQELPKMGANSIGGRAYRAAIVKKDVPKVKDWSLVYKTIVVNYNAHAKKKDGLQDGAFSLLGKSIGKAAVEEAWEHGKQIPGVESYEVVTISLTKI